MTFKQIIRQVAKELDLPEDLVRNTYKSYWKVIKQIIESRQIKSESNQILSQEEFGNNVVNINIPSIGKLYVTLDRYKRMKKMQEYKIQFKQDKYVTHKEGVKTYGKRSN